MRNSHRHHVLAGYTNLCVGTNTEGIAQMNGRWLIFCEHCAAYNPYLNPGEIARCDTCDNAIVSPIIAVLSEFDAARYHVLLEKNE